MTTRDLALAALEQSLNGVLRLDPAAMGKLSRLHGRKVAIHLRGLELTLYLVPDQSGLFQVFADSEEPAECVLSGSPLDLARSGDEKQGPARLFAGDVSIRGDTELAHQVGGVLGNLQIDWEEQLSHVSGDILAHQAGRAGAKLSAYLARSADYGKSNLAEYLTEELHLLPNRAELEQFLEQVDVLRNDTARLEARLQRLEQKQEGKGDEQ